MILKSLSLNRSFALMVIASLMVSFRSTSARWGDIHFKTWSGDFFDFQGECDLVFLHAPDLDMDIHIRTEIGFTYTYISSAAVRIGSDVLEVSGWGCHILNGMHKDNPTSLFYLGGYQVFYHQIDEEQHEFVIVIDEDEDETINLKTSSDRVSVLVYSDSQDHFGRSSGVLKSLDRNGQPIQNNDLVTLGEEWQVRDTEPMLFEAIRDPQYPHPCYMPSSGEQDTSEHTLGNVVSLEAANEACNGLSPAEKELCIFDVMKIGDLEMAQVWFI